MHEAHRLLESTEQPELQSRFSAVLNGRRDHYVPLRPLLTAQFAGMQQELYLLRMTNAMPRYV